MSAQNDIAEEGHQTQTAATDEEHEGIHTGLKPYKCTYCVKCFSLSSQRRRHDERVHTDGKP